ncbi:calcium ATPase [Atractiella rhizophila]|nr:calcium ATPase [Atractiella rhizophila]
MDFAHARSPKEALEYFGVSENSGLKDDQVHLNRQRYGRNELPVDPPTPLWELVLEQFQDKLVLILLASAAISFVLAIFDDGDDKRTAFVEPIVILLILIANAVVGVVQETNAEKAIEALMEYSPDEAKVMRNGKLVTVNAVDLVPGDIVQVAVGDKVPADCRLLSISSASFTVDQAVLTGESVSVGKYAADVVEQQAVKQDMVNMLFSGTTVVSGNARALVVATGPKTAIGNIHTSISSQISEKTPLKQKLDDFGDQLAKVITVICILVWLVNVRNFNDPSHHGWVKGAIYYFKIAVALAVAAIPEGLAVVITTCLALGTKKMAKKNAIVRSLPSVETLGCTNVICSDKTGTLTTNQMSVAHFTIIHDDNVTTYNVEGTTFSPVGRVSAPGGLPVKFTSSIKRLSQISSLCNDARIAYDASNGNGNGNGTYYCVGEPTEAALRVLVEKLETDDEAFNAEIKNLSGANRVAVVNDKIASENERLLTFEFSRDRKSMSVLVKDKTTGAASLLVKGAPESVLERCRFVHSSSGSPTPLTSSLVAELQHQVLDYGKAGLRTLALAYLPDVDPDAAHYKTSSAGEYVKFEQNMVFVGLVAMLDPPRPEVKGAIAQCRQAGIRIIVITGDNQNTAETICRQIGVFGMNEDLEGKSYTGRQFDMMSDEERITAANRASLFSRTEPGHKSRLVDLLQSQGMVVAMTGDGVNDAIALRRASIGIAMGSGTDVAKLASDMILADDNFASIEQAVEEGRSIYENTKQFIRYLISSNIGEVVSIFLTVLLGMPEALIPVQLLWVNLVTDGLPATALGFNPPDHQIMRRPPRNAREPLVGLWLFIRYMVIGIYVGCATVGGYAWWFLYYSGGPQITFRQLTNFHQCSTMFPEIGCEMFVNEMSRKATTVSLSILVTIEMFNAMNSLSENESLLTLPLWHNMYLVGAICLSMALHFVILYVPVFANLFVISPLNWAEWKAVLYISAPVILIDEFFKLLSNTVIAPPTSKAKME